MKAKKVLRKDFGVRDGLKTKLVTDKKGREAGFSPSV